MSDLATDKYGFRTDTGSFQVLDKSKFQDLDGNSLDLIDQTELDAAIAGVETASLTVTEVDGSPSFSATTLRFQNGTVTNAGSGVAEIAGLQGATGATGSTGAKGDKGDTGNAGADGIGTASSVGTLVSSLTAKTTPVDADMIGIADSEASNIWKKLTWANLKATAKGYFDSLYAKLVNNAAVQATFSGWATHAVDEESTSNGEIALGASPSFQVVFGYDGQNACNLRLTNTYAVSNDTQGGFDWYNGTTFLGRLASNGKLTILGDITGGNLSGTNTGDQDLSDLATLADLDNYGLLAGKLSQFATTSSTELRGVISDETGTGALVFGTAPSFVNAAAAQATFYGWATFASTQVETSNGEILLGNSPSFQGIIAFDGANNANMRFTSTYAISNDTAGGFDFYNGSTLLARLASNGKLTVSGDVTGSNLSGTNTGDNAVNSLYSSLVSNATHTGDATGSTALTVVRINGQSLAALTTGLLKNTTTTGVPSIAVAGTDYVLPGGALGTPTSGTLTNCTGYAYANLTGTPATFTPSTHSHAGTDITTGTVDPARLGSGSSITTKFLRGDSTWQTIAGGGGSGITRSISAISTDTTADSTASTDYVYLCTATLNLTLPTASGNTNLYTIKNTGTGVVTLIGTVDGSVNPTISVQNTSLDLISNGTDWNVI